MLLLISVVAAYQLPDKPKDIRSGIFKWAAALGGQRIFLSGQKIKLGSTQLRFEKKDLDMKVVGRELVGGMISINVSDFLTKALESFTKGGEESDSGSSTASTRLLEGEMTSEGCESLPEGSLERSICTALGLGKYTDDKYWGMPMGDFFASLLSYVAVFIVLVVFFVVSTLYLTFYCQLCCCVCTPSTRKKPGLCNLITMILSMTLMAIAVIFYMCGWIGMAKIMEVYKTYDQPDGLIATALDGVKSAVKSSFDADTGFPSVLMPVIENTRTTLLTDMDNVAKICSDVIDSGKNIQTKFTEIYNAVGPQDGATDGIIYYIEENNKIVGRYPVGGPDAKVDTTEIKKQMNDIKDKVDNMITQLDNVNSVKQVPDMINSSFGPALDQAQDVLSDPLKKLLGDKDIDQMIDDLKKKIIGDESSSSELKKYDEVVKTGYNILTCFYMIFGVILIGIIAIWMTAFFTYSCCSRCVYCCAPCCPCLCNCCCLLVGAIGSLACVLMFYIMTWAIDAGDGAAQGIYISSFGDELVIPDINMSGFSNGMITKSLHIDPIKMGNPADLNILDSIFTAGASETKDIVSWLNLETLIPISNIVQNLKTGFSDVLKSVEIPPDIQGEIDKAVEELDKVKIDRRTIFGEVSTQKINEANEEVQKSQMSEQDKQDFAKHCEEIKNRFTPIEQTDGHLDQLSKQKDELVTTLGEFAEKALDSLVGTADHALSNALDIVDQLYPALKKTDFSVCIQVFNAGTEVGLWSLAHLMVCWSIAAHLLLIAMFVGVIMTCVRRPGMADVAPGGLCSSNSASDSGPGGKPRSSRHVIGTGNQGDSHSSSSSSSSGTIVFDSKFPRESNVSKSSDASDSSSSSDRNAGTFIF